jgi:hypothetical protein
VPLVDRFWWLQRLYVLLMIALAAAGVLWYMSYLLPLEQQLNQFVVADAALMALLVCVYLLFAFNSLRLSQAALHRIRRRQQAIESQEEAVPLSRITLGTTPSEAFPEQYLDFTWPDVWSNRISFVFEIALEVGASIFFGIIIWQSLGPLLNITMRQDLEYPVYFVHRLLLGVAWFSIIWAASLPFSYLGVSSLLRLVNPLDMHVDDHGVTWRNMFQVRKVVRWDEARLFEVSGRAVRKSQYGPLHYSHVYALHTRRTTIYWEESTHAIGSPSLRYLHLAEFIHARTGLRPRTLDPDLLAPDEPPLPSTPRDLTFDLLLTGEGTATIIMGFSDSTSAAPVLEVVGFMLLGSWAVNWISTRRRTQRTQRQQSLAAQESNASITQVEGETFAPAGASYVEAPPLSSDVRYGLTTGSRWTFNYNRAIFAVIAAALPVFTLVLVVEEVLAQVIHIRGLHLHPVLPAALITAILFSLLSTIALVSVLRAQPITIIADDQGLHRIGMFGQQLTIEWPEVTAIEVRGMFGNPTFYTVHTATVGASIMWMARPLTHREPDNASGVKAITPDQLAVVVVARSGKQLTTR